MKMNENVTKSLSKIESGYRGGSHTTKQSFSNDVHSTITRVVEITREIKCFVAFVTTLTFQIFYIDLLLDKYST